MATADSVTRRRADRLAALGLVLGLALPLASCDGDPEAPPPAPEVVWPEGTVLSVGGVGITGDEIDAHVPTVALVEPWFVERDHRRKAIAEIVLPIAAARAVLPAEREEAYDRAKGVASAALETGKVPEGTPEPISLTGSWKDVGLVAWGEASRLEPGSFSRLIETPGAWTLVKLLATDAAPGETFSPRTIVTVLRYDFPFIEPEALKPLLKDAIKELKIEVIDPDWEPMIPPRLLY